MSSHSSSSRFAYSGKGVRLGEDDEESKTPAAPRMVDGILVHPGGRPAGNTCGMVGGRYAGQQVAQVDAEGNALSGPPPGHPMEQRSCLPGPARPYTGPRVSSSAYAGPSSVSEVQRERVRIWLVGSEDLSATFDRLDVNDDGFISKQELGALAGAQRSCSSRVNTKSWQSTLGSTRVNIFC